LSHHLLYTKELENIQGVSVLQPNFYSEFVPFRTILFFDKLASEAVKFLENRGIETRTCFYPLHKQPAFSCYSQSESDFFPNSVWAFEHGLCMPVYPQLKTEQIMFICDSVKDFCNA